MQAFLNGRLAPREDLGIDLTDRGFTLADGLFETLLVRGGRIVQLADHLARLEKGLATLGFGHGAPDAETLRSACESVCDANGLDAAVLRVTVTRGAGVRGLAPPETITPTMLVVAAPYAPPPSELTAVVAHSTARNERSPLSRCKALAYQDNILALMEARDSRADDAIMLNTQGRAVCSTVGNLFVRRGEAVLTPALAEGPLPGTVRAAALGAIKQAQEAAITLDELAAADEIVLVNSLSVRRVTQLDGRALPDADPEARSLFDALKTLHGALA